GRGLVRDARDIKRRSVSLEIRGRLVFNRHRLRKQIAAPEVTVLVKTASRVRTYGILAVVYPYASAAHVEVATFYAKGLRPRRINRHAPDASPFGRDIPGASGKTVSGQLPVYACSQAGSWLGQRRAFPRTQGAEGKLPRGAQTKPDSGSRLRVRRPI